MSTSNSNAQHNAQHSQVWARNALGHIVIASNYGWQPAGFNVCLVIPQHSFEGSGPDSGRNVTFEFKSNCRYGIEYMYLTDDIDAVRAALGSSQAPVPEEVASPDTSAGEITGGNLPEGQTAPTVPPVHDPRDLNKDGVVTKQEKKEYRKGKEE